MPMKQCPICGARASAAAATCFECLYHFDTLSTEDVQSSKQFSTSALREKGVEVPKEEMNMPVATMELKEQKASECQANSEARGGGGSGTGGKAVTSPTEDRRGFLVEIRARGQSSRRVHSKRGSAYVGRAPFNEIVIDEDECCRRHVHIYRLPQGVFAEIMGPSAKVLQNGKEAIHLSLLQKGDVLMVAQTELVVTW